MRDGIMSAAGGINSRLLSRERSKQIAGSRHPAERPFDALEGGLMGTWHTSGGGLRCAI